MNAHAYMLDTNILSDLIRNPAGNVFHRLEEVLPATACTSIIVAAEIRYGMTRGVSARLQRQANMILDALDILALEPPVDAHYGAIRAVLERAGQTIGANDLLIAAHARCLNLTLVTANVREFSRVPDLRIENWLSADRPAGGKSE
jgi:tRNA(fMet)-specific endonuclease VapC